MRKFGIKKLPIPVKSETSNSDYKYPKHLNESNIPSKPIYQPHTTDPNPNKNTLPQMPPKPMANGVYDKNYALKMSDKNIFHVRPRVIRRRSFNEENQYKNWCERTLDVFEIVDKIGEGSYGQVYKAKDKHTGS